MVHLGNRQPERSGVVSIEQTDSPDCSMEDISVSVSLKIRTLALALIITQNMKEKTDRELRKDRHTDRKDRHTDRKDRQTDN